MPGTLPKAWLTRNVVHHYTWLQRSFRTKNMMRRCCKLKIWLQSCFACQSLCQSYIVFNLAFVMQADLWSVGAILFQLVTGRPPFDGSTQFQVLITVVVNSLREIISFNSYNHSQKLQVMLVNETYQLPVLFSSYFDFLLHTAFS